MSKHAVEVTSLARTLKSLAAEAARSLMSCRSVAILRSSSSTPARSFRAPIASAWAGQYQLSDRSGNYHRHVMRTNFPVMSSVFIYNPHVN